jgi:integrase
MSVNSNRFSVCKRCNQIYYIGYYLNGRRKWKSTGATVKAEALRALTQFKELLQARGGSVSLEQFNTQFLAYGETNYSPKTLTLYRAILTRFLCVVRNISLPELNPQHIDRYKSERLKTLKARGKQEEHQKVSPISVNVELRMLKAAFNTARRWKLLDSNPFEGVRLAEVPEHEPLYFSAGDFERLVGCIKENWLKEIVILAVLTGMRRGELLNLRWQEVDLQSRLIRIQSTPTFKTKQGRKRVIPLNDTAFYLLQSKHGKDTSDYVFTLNGKQVFDGWLTHAFKKAVRRAKLEMTGLHFHSLRHTFASWLVQDGVSLYEVQKLLGHSSSSVTEVYSHLQPEQMHSTVNRIRLSEN